MGFFSWKTADTQESIANEMANHENAGKTVYLLQPNGEPAFKQEGYEGYGVFGGMDAFVWLAKTNGAAEVLGEDASEEEFRHFGIDINSESGIYKDKEGKLLGYENDVLFRFLGAEEFEGNFMTGQKAYGGKSPNELIESGEWKEVSARDLMMEKLDRTFYPIKLSFNADAVYEDLPASEDCASQGYFYDEFFEDAD